jgi:hypothetical protein
VAVSVGGDGRKIRDRHFEMRQEKFIFDKMALFVKTATSVNRTSKVAENVTKIDQYLRNVASCSRVAQ